MSINAGLRTLQHVHAQRNDVLCCHVIWRIRVGNETLDLDLDLDLDLSNSNGYCGNGVDVSYGCSESPRSSAGF